MAIEKTMQSTASALLVVQLRVVVLTEKQRERERE